MNVEEYICIAIAFLLHVHQILPSHAICIVFCMPQEILGCELKHDSYDYFKSS